MYCVEDSYNIVPIQSCNCLKNSNAFKIKSAVVHSIILLMRWTALNTIVKVHIFSKTSIYELNMK